MRKIMYAYKNEDPAFSWDSVFKNNPFHKYYLPVGDQQFFIDDGGWINEAQHIQTSR